MRKIGLVCVTLMLLGSVSLNAAWARGGHFHGGGLGLGLGLGLLGGYGLGYGFYGRLPYYPPYYGYPPAYGYGPPGYGYGGYAPYGYGYAPAYPPIVTVPSAPVVIQQQPQVVQSPPSVSVPAPLTNYWHYCRKPDGYYPYVKNCPGGWLQVAPQPIQ